jgi:hypothetical protein
VTASSSLENHPPHPTLKSGDKAADSRCPPCEVFVKMAKQDTCGAINNEKLAKQVRVKRIGRKICNANFESVKPPKAILTHIEAQMEKESIAKARKLAERREFFERKNRKMIEESSRTAI